MREKDCRKKAKEKTDNDKNMERDQIGLEMQQENKIQGKRVHFGTLRS